jgi:hypothetical protein
MENKVGQSRTIRRRYSSGIPETMPILPRKERKGKEELTGQVKPGERKVKKKRKEEQERKKERAGQGERPTKPEKKKKK